MKLKTLILVAGLSVAFGSHAASTGTWTPLVETNGTFSFTDGHNDTYNVSVTPAATLTNPVSYYNANYTPQDAVSLASNLASDLNIAGGLTYVGQCNTNCGTSFTSGTAFDYLAMHIGNGELVFNWSVATNSFGITGVDVSQISDYRAYNSLATPLPGAVWLFGSALLGFLGFSTRRKI